MNVFNSMRFVLVFFVMIYFGIHAIEFVDDIANPDTEQYEYIEVTINYTVIDKQIKDNLLGDKYYLVLENEEEKRPYCVWYREWLIYDIGDNFTITRYEKEEI